MNYEVNEFDFVKSLLVPGENILWKGKPEKGGIFTKQDIYLIPFSIFWCGFAVSWFVNASGSEFFFTLGGIPCLLVGIYLLIGRFFVTAYVRKNTVYVITNKKIIRKNGKKLDMLDVSNLPPMYTEIYKNGCGTISFGSEIRINKRGKSYEEPLLILDNIANAAQIQNLIANIKD